VKQSGISAAAGAGVGSRSGFDQNSVRGCLGTSYTIDESIVIEEDNFDDDEDRWGVKEYIKELKEESNDDYDDIAEDEDMSSDLVNGRATPTAAVAVGSYSSTSIGSPRRRGSGDYANMKSYSEDFEGVSMEEAFPDDDVAVVTTAASARPKLLGIDGKSERAMVH
jgi:hypothetical protein